MFTRAPSVEARGLSKGVEQLEVTVLKVILHVIPVVHCGENGDLSTKVPSLPTASPTHPPAALMGASHQQCSHGTAGRGGTRGLAGRASHRPARCSKGPGPDCNWGTGPDLVPVGPVGSRVPGDTTDAREEAQSPKALQLCPFQR